MAITHSQFATQLAAHLAQTSDQLSVFEGVAQKLALTKPNGAVVTLDMTSFPGEAHEADAARLFSGVKTVEALFEAYHQARTSKRFEIDLAVLSEHVHDYARQFLDELFDDAKRTLSDEEAVLIAEWVSNLDIYVAVKAVESLLNSRADLALLKLAPEKGWYVHFDHLAIRCGSSKYKHAEHVAELMREEHGYVSSQAQGEAFYQFDDGWNAYPVYKMLENGQVLRLFLDQSDVDAPHQIIQHWNRVYGFTAHHLAMRVTSIENGCHQAVPLVKLMAALNEAGVEVMKPTGEYTQGLLEQVFTRPERVPDVPEDVVKDLSAVGANMSRVIQNGKLLELVSRKELDPHAASQFFALYGIQYDGENPYHSAPIYQYFLPAQAQHVIHTSVSIA